MKTVLLALTVAAAVVLAGAALAAKPANGGRYDGYLYKGSVVALQKHIRVVVNATGTQAKVLWWCGTPENLPQRQLGSFPVKPDGTFSYVYKTGSLVVWSFKGRFVSRTTARVALQAIATCDGKGGTVNLVLQS